MGLGTGSVVGGPSGGGYIAAATNANTHLDMDMDEKEPDLIPQNKGERSFCLTSLSPCPP